MPDIAPQPGTLFVPEDADAVLVVEIGAASKATQVELLPENRVYHDPNEGLAASRQPTTDYAVFHDNFDGSIRTMCRRLGLFGDECDEMMQRLWLYFLEHRLLERYDVTRGLPFQGYVFNYTHRLIQKFKYTLYRVHSHELSTPAIDAGRIDLSDGDNEDDTFDGVSFLDATAAMVEVDTAAQSYLSIVEVNELLTKTYEALSGLPATSTKDFARLFYDVVVQVALDGEVNQQALADRYKALLQRSFSRQAVQQHFRQMVATPPLLALRDALRGIA